MFSLVLCLFVSVFTGVFGGPPRGLANNEFEFNLNDDIFANDNNNGPVGPTVDEQILKLTTELSAAENSIKNDKTRFNVLKEKFNHGKGIYDKLKNLQGELIRGIDYLASTLDNIDDQKNKKQFDDSMNKIIKSMEGIGLSIPDILHNPYNRDEFNGQEFKLVINKSFENAIKSSARELGKMQKAGKDIKASIGLARKTIKSCQEELKELKNKSNPNPVAGKNIYENPKHVDNINLTLNDNGRQKRSAPVGGFDNSKSGTGSTSQQFPFPPWWGFNGFSPFPIGAPYGGHVNNQHSHNDKIVSQDDTQKDEDRKKTDDKQDIQIPTIFGTTINYNDHFHPDGSSRYNMNPYSNPGLYDPRYMANPGGYNFPYYHDTKRTRFNGDFIVPIKNPITTRLAAIDPTMTPLIPPSNTLIKTWQQYAVALKTRLANAHVTWMQLIHRLHAHIIQESDFMTHMVSSVSAVDGTTKAVVASGKFSQTKHYGLACQTMQAIIRDILFGLPNMAIDFRKQWSIEMINFSKNLFVLPTVYDIKKVGNMVSQRYADLIKGKRPNQIFETMCKYQPEKEPAKPHNKNKKRNNNNNKDKDKKYDSNISI